MFDAVSPEPYDAGMPIGVAARPEPRSFAPRETRSWEARREDSALADALIELLRSAGRRLPENCPEANVCIDRALILLEADRLRREADGAPSPAMGGLSPWRMRRVEQHIEENLDVTIRIEDLAVIAKLSVRHFSLAFKQSFGVPPHAHIVRRRIEKAQELMLLTDEPLAQVALACGLTDQAHLSKWFRRLAGVSPNAWRRHYRG